jgi:hypothetical protein
LNCAARHASASRHRGIAASRHRLTLIPEVLTMRIGNADTVNGEKIPS